MKKRFLAVVLVAIFCCSVMVGCGKTEKKAVDGNKISFTVGNWPTEKGAELDYMNDLKEQFEKKYSNITIVPDTWKFSVDTFYAKAASGQLPNLYSTNFTEVEQIMKNGYSRDITGTLKNNGYYDNFNKQVLGVVSKDNKVYSFPYNAYTLGIAYDTELFRKAGLMNEDDTPIVPQTWDELREMAVKIKEATGVPGFIFPTSQNCGGWMFTCLAWSFGVDFMEQDSEGKWKATFGTEECAEALQYIKDLKWKYDVLPATTNIGFNEMYTLWCTGRGAMLLTSNQIGASVKSNQMDMNHVGMFRVPAGPKRQVSLLGGKVYNISPETTDEQTEAILKFIEFQGNSPYSDEESMANFEKSQKTNVESNIIVGLKGMSVWNEDTDRQQKRNEIIDKYTNVNANHFKDYNDSLIDGDIEIQAEEPIYCQELYGILDNCIQRVLTDKNADCREIVNEAANKFQKNYLDK